MASIKEIRTRISSVDQTLKITNAMYLISSSKMRKARQQLNGVEPYFNKIQETIADILYHSHEFQHPFMDTRPEKKKRTVGYIVITGDKGLAGAYNHNVLKLAEEKMAAEKNDVMLFVVGQVGRAYFAGKNVPVDAEFLYTAQDPTVARARDMSETVVEMFLKGQLDEVYVVYTNMVSPMVMEPETYRLLPLTRDQFPSNPVATVKGEYNRQVVYVPSEHKVMDKIVPGYIKGVIFGCLVESFCSEQNARMTAMDSSTKNAREMIRTLSLEYNRARQAAITQEITEIVGGAQNNGKQLRPETALSPSLTVLVQADGTVLHRESKP
jgi:F-type H+-transporting ATPase subunit gamma